MKPHRVAINIYNALVAAVSNASAAKLAVNFKKVGELHNEYSLRNLVSLSTKNRRKRKDLGQPSHVNGRLTIVCDKYFIFRRECCYRKIMFAL